MNMHLNGDGWKVLGAFAGVLLAIVLTFSASQSRLSALEVSMKAVDRRVDDLKTDATKTMDRMEGKLDKIEADNQARDKK